jgi:polyisoprenoid-binding protein YceI
MSTQRLDAPSDLGLPAGTWSPEPSASRLEFAVKTMWGLATVRGRFERFDGKFELEPEDARAELIVDASSFDTGHEKRDTHLRSADFFDVPNYPTLSFVATAITRGDRDALTISGDLTVAGHVVRLHLPVRVTRGEQGRLRLSTSATVPREQVGMTWNRGGMIRGDIHLTAEVELRRAEDAAPDDGAGQQVVASPRTAV